MRTYLLPVILSAFLFCGPAHATTVQGVVVRDDSGAAIISAAVMVTLDAN